MNAQTDMLKTSQLVLRVIAGRQQGAEYRLTAGIRASIGHNLHHDIVLRNNDAKAVSVELDLTGELAMLSVIAGEISVLGRTLAAGETAPLPHFMPVKIGGIVFAIGTPASERWDEAAQISAAAIPLRDSADEADTIPTGMQGTIAKAETVSIERKVDGALRHFSTRFRPLIETLAIERRWPIYAVTMATLLLAIILFAPVRSFIGEQTHGVEATDRMLAQNGFADLEVKAMNGTLLVGGVLADDAQLQRLRRLLDARRPGAVIDVTTMDALAAGVTDMLTAQNIDALAKPGRGRNILIASEYLPADRQMELAAQIRADMPAIRNISFQIDSARGEPDLQYFFASEKFGLASFVDGDPSYITTADGTKWFKGAMVPTGHTILNIGNGTIRFEREGQIEELRITPAAASAVAGGVSDAKTNLKE
ncbi:MAG: SctD/MshK family protein [Sphingorhabdus sp.]